MIITGITPQQFKDVVEKVSSIVYQDNLTTEIGTIYSSTRFTGRVVAKRSGAGTHGDDCAPGARRSWSGRRGPWACWHAYRDVLEQLFWEYPDAKVRTSMAKYIGREGFKDNYPQTAWQNIGSVFAPAYMPDMCDC